MTSAKASLACVTHAGLVPHFMLLTFETPSRTFQIVSVTCLIRQRNHISLSYTGAFSALRFHSSSCKRRVCRAQTRPGCRRSLSLSLGSAAHVSSTLPRTIPTCSRGWCCSSGCCQTPRAPGPQLKVSPRSCEDARSGDGADVLGSCRTALTVAKSCALQGPVPMVHRFVRWASPCQGPRDCQGAGHTTYTQTRAISQLPNALSRHTANGSE